MSKKLTTEQFIAKARAVHGDLYDYSKVVYINNRTKVLIIDPEYGEFEQTPGNHLSGSGNPIRGGSKKLTTEQFVEKAREVHGNTYDYSKVVYSNAKTRVLIIDPEYGEFEQIPDLHLIGCGNPIRGAITIAKKKRSNTDDFIAKARAVHGDLYDYSKVVYYGTDRKVLIIDPIHGEFEQRPSDHLRGKGNPGRGKLTSVKKRTDTRDDFIAKACEVHGNLYDYSKVVYKDNNTKVLIIDPEYGEFEQRPYDHLSGSGNPIRGGSAKLTTDEFITKARAIHGDFYDYSKVVYINAITKVLIIDPEYGEFEQIPGSHLNGCGNPIRGGHNYKYNYISGLFDVHGNCVYLKYGIESVLNARVSPQNRKCVYEVRRLATFCALDHYSCTQAENVCIRLFQEENQSKYLRNGIVTKEEMEDGYSETTSVLNYDRIVEIYEEHGAALVSDDFASTSADEKVPAELLSAPTPFLSIKSRTINL